MHPYFNFFAVFMSGSAVDAVILEAAFTTIGEVVAIHPVTKVRLHTSICIRTEMAKYFFLKSHTSTYVDKVVNDHGGKNMKV